MVKTVQERVENHLAATEPLLKRGPGRPALGDGATASLRITVPVLRRWHAALMHGLNEARTVGAKRALADAIAGLETRLGPRLAPDWKPATGARQRSNAVAYRIVQADGTEQVIVGAAKAAAAMGVTTGTFGVSMSRCKGTWRRRVGESVVTCHKILA